MSDATNPSPPPQPAAPLPRPAAPPDVLNYAAAPPEFRWDGLPAFAGMAVLALHSAAAVVAILDKETSYGPMGCCAGSLMVMVAAAVGTAALASTLAVFRAAGLRRTRGPGEFALAGLGWSVGAWGWFRVMPAFDAVARPVAISAALACVPFALLGVAVAFVVARPSPRPQD